MKVELPFDGYDFTGAPGGDLVITEPMKRLAEKMLMHLALVRMPGANADMEWRLAVDSEGRVRLMEYWGDSFANTNHWRAPSLEALMEAFESHVEGNFSGGWEDEGEADMKSDAEIKAEFDAHNARIDAERKGRGER